MKQKRSWLPFLVIVSVQWQMIGPFGNTGNGVHLSQSWRRQVSGGKLQRGLWGRDRYLLRHAGLSVMAKLCRGSSSEQLRRASETVMALTGRKLCWGQGAEAFFRFFFGDWPSWWEKSNEKFLDWGKDLGKQVKTCYQSRAVGCAPQVAKKLGWAGRKKGRAEGLQLLGSDTYHWITIFQILTWECLRIIIMCNWKDYSRVTWGLFLLEIILV